ncbi:hypothetical protein WJX79_010211 [Trebouxia sp. C0005]
MPAATPLSSRPEWSSCEGRGSAGVYSKAWMPMQHPTLAAALGFPESTDFDAEPVSVNEQPHTGEGDHHQINQTALPHEASAAHQPSVADAADCVPEQVTKRSLINTEGARPRSSSSKHHRPRTRAKRQIRAASNKEAGESPKYMLVMRNLNKRQYRQLQGRLRRKGVKVNNWDHLMSWLSPAQRGSHTPWWTFIFTAALLVIFFFMAGSYGMYLASQSGLVSSGSNTAGVTQYDNIETQTRASAPSASAQGSMIPGSALSPEAGEVVLTDYSLSTNTSITAEEVEEWVRSGPSSMSKWVSWQADWRLFDFDFLLEWGGRYGPALHQGQWWRWMTWVFVHEGFQHMVSNVLVWLALALPLEHAYGTPRILAVWLISALGSAFFSAAFEDSCTLVVGCSGAVFGFMGLYVADMVLNFKSLSFPWLRLIWIGATLAYFLVASITQGQGAYVSYWAHLGGFVCGLFPSFFFLPNLKDKRWRAASKLANRLGLLSRNSGKHKSQKQRKRAEVSGYSPASQLAGQPDPALRLGTLRGAAGQADDTRGNRATTVLGVFLALPLYLYLDRFPHMEC